MKCKRWGPEIRKLWQRVQIDCESGGAPSVRRLFGDERATQAILEFLENTRVGKMPNRILSAGGPGLEEDLEYVSLQVLGDEGEESQVSLSEEEDGPGPPS